MANTIVLVTAIIPTIGHKYLIEFAKNLAIMNFGKVHIILCSLDSEPISGENRFLAINKIYKEENRVVVHHLKRDVPQNPNDHPNFWDVWRDIVREFVDVKPDDYFVASELYGIDMARVLGCKFMPCNRYREVIPITGSAVRSDIIGNFSYILPEFQHHLLKKITIFGAESCGKTTMAKRLAKDMNGWFIPEWAREYLETVGVEVTDEKMANITEGQFASMITVIGSLHNKPWIFFDTDLLSTIGYYRIYGGDKRADMNYVHQLFYKTKSDLYIVMNDEIPFEPDILRYGGSARESKTQFWVDLLKEFKCQYYMVNSGTHEWQANEIKHILYRFYRQETANIREYKRA